jgi:5-methylcytosine-specific restriction endonuclease McrA
VDQHASERDLVAFAERVLALLDQGSFVATYKYAVLLALMDLCLEKTNRHGNAPDSVTTRELAEKVVELYWPQTAEFRGQTLRQNSGRQARILTDIARFRASLGDPSTPLDRARRQAPAGFERLVRDVEWTLILMPLPRLQVLGGETERLLYHIGWGLEIERTRRVVVEYQRTRTGFDNRILLFPKVGDHLVMLNGLLRPLIHRAWSAMVAQLNGLDESRLESFLFGIDRAQLKAVRPGLLELQHGRCFYCGGPLTRQAEVDHFIPWVRYPDNGIENLVVADDRCNGAKRDFLAAGEHVTRWTGRNRAAANSLTEIAQDLRWERHPDETLGVARGLYLRLPARARLWLRRQDFCPPNRDELHAALT